MLLKPNEFTELSTYISRGGRRGELACSGERVEEVSIVMHGAGGGGGGRPDWADAGESSPRPEAKRVFLDRGGKNEKFFFSGKRRPYFLVCLG